MGRLGVVLGVIMGVLAISIVGYPAQAHYAPGMTGVGYHGIGMMRGFGFANMAVMHNAMTAAFANGTGQFDMNAMHRAMHGEQPDVDMNQMHARMISGNLTQEDINEMKEHCPMMRGT